MRATGAEFQWDAGVSVASMTPRSAATRAKLISVAERLFAEREVEAVSVNEITKAAKQRHNNACHYHFGGKTGLIQAILDKHIPWIAVRRNAMFDAMEVAGTLDLRGVIEAFVRPVVAKLLDPDGGKEFIRITAQMIVQHTLSTEQPGLSPFILPATDRLMRTFMAAVSSRDLPDAIIRHRLTVAAIMLFHGLADYTRILEARKSPAAKHEIEIFVNDLEDMILGALTAPSRAAPARG